MMESNQQRTLKILHLRASPFLGSPERLILGRIRRMYSSACQYTVGIFDEQRGSENDFCRLLRQSETRCFILYNSMAFFALNLFSIVRRAKESGAQVICGHDYKSNFYSVFASLVLRIPALSVFHGRTSTDAKIATYQRVDDFMLHFMDLIVCVSESTRDGLRHKFSDDKLRVIPNAVDIEEIERLSREQCQQYEEKYNDECRNVVFVGRLSREKGLDFLVMAAEILRRKRLNVTFSIIGEGPEKRKLCEMIRERNLQGFVRLLGFKANVYPYMKSSDLLVLPSLTEGMPIVILEAFALSKPVIATRVGGVAEVIRDGENGLLVKPGDPLALAESMELLLRDSERAAVMGQRAYSIVKEGYTFVRQASDYLSAYQAVLEERGCAPISGR